MSATQFYVQVVFPLPYPHLYTYVSPEPCRQAQRVLVAFGRGKRLALVVESSQQPPDYAGELKPIEDILDAEPLWSAQHQKLLEWLAHYYVAPLGLVMFQALPPFLRQKGALKSPGLVIYRPLPSAFLALQDQTLARAPQQWAVLNSLVAQPQSLEALKQSFPTAAKHVQSLLQKGLIEGQSLPCFSTPERSSKTLQLGEAQQQVVQGILQQDDFRVHLLFGVTGSGKTHVYLALAKAALNRGKQVLWMVPEIGLTPQMAEHIAAYLEVSFVVIHSNLSDGERVCAFEALRSQQVPLVLSTRSGVLSPMPNLGLILVDEEQDASYKQQETLHFHARDLAIMRAQLGNFPIVLGSATPSLETWAKAQGGDYSLWSLPQRHQGAQLPQWQWVDIRGRVPKNGLSGEAIAAIKENLLRGEQTMVFLNRRGFAPVYLCGHCAWQAMCHACDKPLTYHQQSHRLKCHHCGFECAPPEVCPNCLQNQWVPHGIGTESLEKTCIKLFPQAKVLRLDRDVLTRKNAWQDALSQIHGGEADILVGTQLLVKGHHFARLTLVVVVDMDGAWHAVDFRALERMLQSLVQVAGRAGREMQQGKILVQTLFAQQPLLQWVAQGDMPAVLNALLQERQTQLWPPFRHLVLIRAAGKDAQRTLGVLADLAQTMPRVGGVEVWGPVSAVHEKLAGKYRYVLLVVAKDRKARQQWLKSWPWPQVAGVKVSLDVDPLDLY